MVHSGKENSLAYDTKMCDFKKKQRDKPGKAINIYYVVQWHNTVIE